MDKTLEFALNSVERTLRKVEVEHSAQAAAEFILCMEMSLTAVKRSVEEANNPGSTRNLRPSERLGKVSDQIAQYRDYFDQLAAKMEAGFGEIEEHYDMVFNK
jgi:hypothetical protein